MTEVRCRAAILIPTLRKISNDQALKFAFGKSLNIFIITGLSVYNGDKVYNAQALSL